MNPIIESYEVSGNRIDVVRDDLLPGGTKQAAIMEFIRTMPDREMVYASPRQGYAQIALAAACRSIGRKATIFTAKSKTWHERTIRASGMGAEIVEIPFGYLSVTQSRARKYCEESGSRLMPFGFSCREMVDAISNRAVSLGISPAEVWSVAGSGTLQQGLQQAWPDAKFYAIQIGKRPEAGIAELIIAPERYEQPAKDKPPFPSCDNYDAKAWQFIKQIASDGALFWNVAA
jgi:hypothetical protein